MLACSLQWPQSSQCLGWALGGLGPISSGPHVLRGWGGGNACNQLRAAGLSTTPSLSGLGFGALTATLANACQVSEGSPPPLSASTGVQAGADGHPGPGLISSILPTAVDWQVGPMSQQCERTGLQIRPSNYLWSAHTGNVL